LCHLGGITKFHKKLIIIITKFH